MKIITIKWLKKEDACKEGIKWFKKQKEREVIKVVKALMNDKHLDWANWLLPRTMTYKQYVSYAIFAAEQCLSRWEKKYPKDRRPRKAIEAAKKCLKNPSKKNKDAAWSARSAAWSAAESAARSTESAARSARSAESAAWSAESAAWPAESTAWSAAWPAESTARSATESAAESAARSARSAESAAWPAELVKILKYGIKILNTKSRKVGR